MLVISVVEDDQPTLTVTDSLGTSIQLAVGSHISQSQSPVCGSPSTYCQADIYWGMLSNSGPDSVTVMEPGSNVALRVQVWEFSGVNGIGNTASCRPSCPVTSYPQESILLATGSTVTGAGSGFTWEGYTASAVAGSEYMLSPTYGSTTFSFSPQASLEEVGVILTVGVGVGGPVTQSCTNTDTPVYTPQSTISCSPTNQVLQGDTLVVELDDVAPSLSDSLGDTYTLLTSVAIPGSTYLDYYYYTVVKTSAPDTITLTGQGNYPEMIVHELHGAGVVSTYSTGSGTSNTPSVTSYSPAAGSFVLAFVETGHATVVASAGPGYTLLSQTAVALSDEYLASSSGSTTSPFAVTSSLDWAEISVSFSSSSSGGSLAVSISPTTLTTTSSATITASGGTPNGQFYVYGINSANGIKYQLYPAVSTFGPGGSASVPVNLANSPALLVGSYTMSIWDVSSGKTATGNSFSVSSGSSSAPTIVQTCTNAAVPPLQVDPAFTCALASPVTQGDMIVVEVSDVAPAVADSQGNTYTLLTSVPVPDQHLRPLCVLHVREEQRDGRRVRGRAGELSWSPCSRDLRCGEHRCLLDRLRNLRHPFSNVLHAAIQFSRHRCGSGVSLQLVERGTRLLPALSNTDRNSR